MVAVKELYLARNRIEDSGATALALALLKNKSLEVLILSRNRIGDDGSRSLGETLKNQRSI